MAGDQGLRQLMMFGTYDRDQVCYARDRMRPVITRLVERAQASGDLRADFQATDVKMIAFMLASIAEYAAAATPEVWRRYLAMLVDGLRPARDGVTELPVPAPTAADLEQPDDRARPAPRHPPLNQPPGARRPGPAAPPLHVHPHARLSCVHFSGAAIVCIVCVQQLPLTSTPHPMHVHTHSGQARVHPPMPIMPEKMDIIGSISRPTHSP